MNEDIFYHVNTSKTVNETLEGETIIINLETGNYYSMNKTGSILWNKIEANYSLSQILAFFEEQYSASSETIKKSILDLISFLKADDLILETKGKAKPVSLEKANGKKEAFVAPVIELYEDMKEMLLADPIHDVGEVGWPVLKK